jgi:hypothetical protein
MILVKKKLNQFERIIILMVFVEILKFMKNLIRCFNFIHKVLYFLNNVE